MGVCISNPVRNGSSGNASGNGGRQDDVRRITEAKPHSFDDSRDPGPTQPRRSFDERTNGEETHTTGTLYPVGGFGTPYHGTEEGGTSDSVERKRAAQEATNPLVCMDMDLSPDGFFDDDEPLRPGKEFVETMAVFEVGENVGDKYEVMEVMNCGTLGRTYRARSAAHDAQCVFKTVCFVSREPLVESVREDQKVLTRLQHANVLPVFDVMEDPNHENMIIVTSYVPSRNISRHAGMLRQPNVQEQMERLRVMLRDIGVGIRVLHSHHVYHHNIKLENLLETKDGGCCIADAGYSKLFSSLPVESLVNINNGGLLPPDLFLENVDMSQEVAAGKIDVWSFGWCMYQLAFGTEPYTITPDMPAEEVRKIVISHKLKCPMENCPTDLWEVIKWSLEKRAKERPNIMKLLRHQFFRIGNGQSFVEAGASSSFAAGSMMHVHRSITDQHTGFVMSIVLGKGPHSENFLVHLPSLPAKLFVLKALNNTLSKRLAELETAVELDWKKKLAMSHKIRNRHVAHYYEIVDNNANTFATQRFFPKGNLAINYPQLEQEGASKVVRMLADVMRGLVRLHDVGLYHLNLKPSNVFYSESFDGFVIADFGPLIVAFSDLYDAATMTFRVGLPEHLQQCIRDKGDHGLPFIDTFCVGLLAASVLPDVRLLVWDQLYGASSAAPGSAAKVGDVVDVEKAIGRLVLRNQQQQLPFPPFFLDFVTTALTSCKTVRELMGHPFIGAECKPEDLAVSYFDVHAEDIRRAVREKFVCRDETRLADLLGHGGFRVEPQGAYSTNTTILGRCISAQSMDRRASAATANGNEDTLSVSQQERSIVGGAVSTPGGCDVDTKRISYAFVEKMVCGQCKKELKYVLYRCPECSDYLRCGKCVTVDDHGHELDPFVIENVCHADADDEDMMIAILAPPSAINKHAVEELEMQADLPTGTLLRGYRAANTRSFRKSVQAKSLDGGAVLSRGASMSLGNVSPRREAAPTSEVGGGSGVADDDDDCTATCKPPKRLLMEHEANEDTTPLCEIEQCRANNELELMLHNFDLERVPREVFDPPLSHIVHLNLANNKLVALPHDISFLMLLQRLSLAANQLVVLPDSIGDLQDLQYLDVSHNALEDLPQSLMFADKLDTIAMDYNNCCEIPGVILDMPQLRVIYLAENRRINKWPPVAQLMQLGPLKFGLDNEPLLWQEFHTIKDKIESRISVMWNKIYPDEIIPHLFCGSLRSAQSLAVYDRLQITYLLTVGRGLNPIVIDGMQHKTEIVDDIEGAVIDSSFAGAVAFIDDALRQNTGCLVHCFAGMSRSATTVIAFLMMRRGMRLDEAYCITRKGRPAIYPNAGFFTQLLNLDAKLFPDGRPLDMASMERHMIPSA